MNEGEFPIDSIPNDPTRAISIEAVMDGVISWRCENKKKHYIAKILGVAIGEKTYPKCDFAIELPSRLATYINKLGPFFDHLDEEDACILVLNCDIFRSGKITLKGEPCPVFPISAITSLHIGGVCIDLRQSLVAEDLGDFDCDNVGGHDSTHPLVRLSEEKSDDVLH